MRLNAACVSVLLALAALSFILSGCAGVQTPTVSNEAANHENVTIQNVQVVKVRYRKTADGLVVSGRLRRTCNFCYDDVPGHVDIAILDPNDLIMVTTSCFYYPRSIPKSGGRYSSFSTKLKASLPDGYVIRTAYHDYPKSTGYATDLTTFQCNANMAAPQVEAETVVKAPE